MALAVISHHLVINQLHELLALDLLVDDSNPPIPRGVMTATAMRIAAGSGASADGVSHIAGMTVSWSARDRSSPCYPLDNISKATMGMDELVDYPSNQQLSAIWLLSGRNW